MDTAFKKAKSSKVNVRREALQALVSWETGRSNLDRISQGFLKFLPESRRALYTELTKGTLRYLLSIDHKLKYISTSPIDELTPWIRNILRLGGYQLEYMNHPKPLTVNAMVELAKIYGHPGTVKLVNGVLRKWASGVSAPLPEPLAEQISVLYSHPQWLVEKWLARWGEKETRDLLLWNNTLPSLDVCINLLRIDDHEFLKLCKDAGVTALPSFLKEGFTLKSDFSPEKLPGLREGLFWVQSLSAQLPVHLLNPLPGELILDLCAAPGGKSCQMASLTGDKGRIIAVDNNEERLKKVDQNRKRLGMRSIIPLKADGTALKELPGGAPDAILVDAPCSATGVLRREVDARWKKTADDLLHNQELQLALLQNAGRLLKPGGRIVYSTCSLEPDENEDVAKRFLHANPRFSLEEPPPFFVNSVQEGLMRSKPFVKILPQKDQMDGFFMARLKKNG